MGKAQQMLMEAWAKSITAVGSTPADVGSKMLVTATGLDFGTVGAFSNGSGTGSTFKVRLPLASEATGGTPQDPKPFFRP